MSKLGMQKIRLTHWRKKGYLVIEKKYVIFPFSNILYRDEKDITRQSETSECFSFVCKLPKVGGPHHINPGTLNANSVHDGHSTGYQKLQLLRAAVRQGLLWYVGVLLVQCTPNSNPPIPTLRVYKINFTILFRQFFS